MTDSRETHLTRALTEQFAQLWNTSDSPPDVFAFLTEHADALPVEQAEVLLFDQARRWASGTGMAVEEYLSRCPSVASDETLKLQLIVEEYGHRQELGDADTVERFIARFPELKEKLQNTLSNALDGDETVGKFPGEAMAETHVPGAMAAPTAAVAAPCFGDYELLEQIAQGGMGVVYKARQTKLNRVVALKMIKTGELAGDEEVKRFHAEAEAAAQLDHPEIVPIYEVGEWRAEGVSPPVHFFSMGYVEGRSLADRLKDGPLPPREAAELIAQIARAVQYAHEKGIIHRDLKPANVLIDVDGKPRITDFGLAKNIASDSGMTSTGQVLGTPSYMPKEQAQGEIENVGPHADVYSLGAVLYATLTGRPPFQAANVVETLKQVIENDPVAVRELNPAVERDLETICLKCLEKPVSRRYRSAQELADELGRFLEHKPILARRVGRFERGRRWCRRNPLGTAVIALLAILAIGGSSMAAVLQRSLAAETAARELATKNAERANRNLDNADEVVARFLTEVGTRNGVLFMYPATQPLRKTLLAMGREYYEKLIADNPNAELSPRLASANFKLGSVLVESSGDSKDALRAFKRALAGYKRLARDEPGETKYQVGLGATNNSLGLFYWKTGEFDNALSAFQQSLAIKQLLLTEVADRPIWQSDLADVHHNIGLILRERGETNEALEKFRLARAIREKLVQAEPNNATFQSRLAISQRAIGDHFRSVGKPDDALKRFRQALRIHEMLAREFPVVPRYRSEVAKVLLEIGVLHRVVGERKESLSCFNQALVMLEKLSRNNPTVASFRMSLALCHNNIGASFAAAGERKKALAAYLLAIEIEEALVNENPEITRFADHLAASQSNVGVIHHQLGNVSQAIEAFQHAARLQDRLMRLNPRVPKYRSKLAASYNNIGLYHKQAGDTKSALDAFRKGIKMREQLVRSNPEVTVYQSELASIRYNTGLLLTRARQPIAALDEFQQAVAVLNNLARAGLSNNVDEKEQAKCYYQIGRLHQQSRKSQDAVNAFRQCIAIHRQLLDLNPDAPEQRVDLAQTALAAGLAVRSSQTEAALEFLRQCIPLFERIHRDDPENVLVKRMLQVACAVCGAIYDRDRNHRLASTHWRKAWKSAVDPKRRRYARERLCLSLARNGQHTEAESIASQLLGPVADANVAVTVLRTHSLSSAAARCDALLRAAERKRLSAKYATRGISLLEPLGRSGFFSKPRGREMLKSEPDLNPLRHRDDFRAFAYSVGVKLPAWAKRPASSNGGE